MQLIFFAGLMIAMALADGDSLISGANEQFTARMFNEVVKSIPDKSVISSAFSVLSPLGQLAVGSVDETHDQILKTIGLANDNETKAAFTELNSKVRSIKGVVLKTGNRIYIAKDAELNPDFAVISRDVFNSDLKNVDFADNDKTAGEINAWVESQTNNKIKNLVDPKSIDGTTRALLVNAIYFKGSWKKPFDKLQTKDGDFHVTKDKIVKVPFMHQTANMGYVESSELDAKIVEIPYEDDETYFVIVLPNKDDGINDLLEKLKSPSALSKAQKQVTQKEVILTMPKFNIETTINLEKVLTKMDITDLFDAGKAKLNNLLKGESKLFISAAIQKAFIEVNEEGSEAGAANVFNGMGSSPFSDNLNADRPFYFEIINEGIPLFQGIVYEP